MTTDYIQVRREDAMAFVEFFTWLFSNAETKGDDGRQYEEADVSVIVSSDGRERLDRLSTALSAEPVVAEGETFDPVALREQITYACDLLAERKYGSSARSPGHNARLVLEDVLSDLPAWPSPQPASGEGKLRKAALKVIEMNRQHAEDQYGDAEKAEGWACVVVLRQALKDTCQ